VTATHRSRDQRPLTLRRQWLALRVQPRGQVPFDGSGMASWAPSRGTQKLPDDA
jgi:hypothetical protein